MKILSLDSSALTSTVALVEDGKAVCDLSVTSELNHSVTLLPLIDAALGSSGWTLDSVDAFAISQGPGSFTGVRIGVSLIKGLAFGRNKPCVGVSTLEALAYNLFPLECYISPVMDARREQVYNALFCCDGKMIKRLCGDRAVPLEELKKDLEKLGNDVFLVGDGSDMVFENITLPNVKKAPVLLKYQNAAAVGLCAFDKLKRGEGIFTDKELRATYLRLPQAERERLEKLEKE